MKRLKEAGFGETQAEAVTGVFRDLRDADYTQLATKADLERIESELKGDIARQGTELKGEIARLDAKIDLKSEELKADIIRWVFGIAVAQTALVLGVFRLFSGGH